MIIGYLDPWGKARNTTGEFPKIGDPSIVPYIVGSLL